MRGIATVGLGLSALVTVASPVPAGALGAETQAALRSADLLYVATQRRDGSRSRSAPVWFVYLGENELFFTTSPGSWKAKRIARGSPLYLNVGRADGPALLGTPRPVHDPALIDRMGAAYADKYWIAWLGLFKPRRGRVASGKTLAYVVALEPAP